MKLIIIIISMMLICSGANAKVVFNMNECDKISMIAKRNLKGYHFFLDKASGLILDKKYKEAGIFGKMHVNEKKSLVEWATIYNAFCK